MSMSFSPPGLHQEISTLLVTQLLATRTGLSIKLTQVVEETMTKCWEKTNMRSHHLHGSSTLVRMPSILRTQKKLLSVSKG